MNSAAHRERFRRIVRQAPIEEIGTRLATFFATLPVDELLAFSREAERRRVPRSPAKAPAPAEPPVDVETAERRAVTAALAATRGNRFRAATILGMGRTTLYTKLRAYGLVP
jgi:transcriptional regulator of acetoin/glycerol metabolism